jgi:predicted nucleic-acid-binding Zn-ribbon protein
LRTGVCPKCRATTVYKKAEGVGFAERVVVRTGWLNAPSRYDSYICTTCGYFENYIADRGKLEEVARRWDPARG